MEIMPRSVCIITVCCIMNCRIISYPHVTGVGAAVTTAVKGIFDSCGNVTATMQLSGQPLLHSCCAKAPNGLLPFCVKEVLQLGADLNQWSKDEYCSMPLMHLCTHAGQGCRRNDKAVNVAVCMLIQEGANLHACNSYGRTTSAFAVLSENWCLVQLLLCWYLR